MYMFGWFAVHKELFNPLLLVPPHVRWVGIIFSLHRWVISWKTELQLSLLPHSLMFPYPAMLPLSEPTSKSENTGQIRWWVRFLMRINVGLKLQVLLFRVFWPQHWLTRGRDWVGTGGSLQTREDPVLALTYSAAAPYGEGPMQTVLLHLFLFSEGSEACEWPGPGCAWPVRLWGGRLRLGAWCQPSWGKLTLGPGRLWPGMCLEYCRVLQTRYVSSSNYPLCFRDKKLHSQVL